MTSFVVATVASIIMAYVACGVHQAFEAKCEEFIESIESSKEGDALQYYMHFTKQEHTLKGEQ
jgi:hypothetical protein